MTKSNLDLSFKQRDLLYRLALVGCQTRGCSLQAQPSTILSLWKRGLIDSPDYVKGVFPTTSMWQITEKGQDIVNVLQNLDLLIARRRQEIIDAKEASRKRKTTPRAVDPNNTFGWREDWPR